MTTTTKAKSRAARITIGAVLAAVGTVSGLSGAGVLAYTGSDGAISSGQHELSTPTTALVSEAAKLNHTDDIAAILGDPEVKLAAKSSDDKRIFIGIAREADVDRYLAGAPIDRVTDFEVKPYNLDTQRRPGSATPAAPADQSFWVAESSGQEAKVDWKVADGTYRVVVMNADASPGVATDGEIELDVPHLTSIALLALLLGFAGLAGGIALMTPPSMSISAPPVRRSV